MKLISIECLANRIMSGCRRDTTWSRQSMARACRSPELLQNAVQQAQRLLTRVWEWLCSLFGYRWQAQADHQVLYRLF